METPGPTYFLGQITKDPGFEETIYLDGFMIVLLKTDIQKIWILNARSFYR